MTVSGLISINLVPPCRMDLGLLCCCNLFSNKNCEFVVSAGSSYTMVQEELLVVDDSTSKSFAMSFTETPCIDNIS